MHTDQAEEIVTASWFYSFGFAEKLCHLGRGKTHMLVSRALPHTIAPNHTLVISYWTWILPVNPGLRWSW